MKINRVWAMPNKNTFTIKPIGELIKWGLDAEANKVFGDSCEPTSAFIEHLMNVAEGI